MTLATRRSPRDMPQTVPLAKVKMLGNHSGIDYVEIDGREYALGRPAILDSSYITPAGEIVTSEHVTEFFDGTRQEVIRHRRARPVPAGTFAGLTAAEDAKRKAAEAKASPRPINLLGRTHLFGRRAERVLALGAGSSRDPLPFGPVDPDVGAAMLKMQAVPKLLISPPNVAPQTPGEYLARAEAAGIALTVTAGGLLDRRKRGGLAPQEDEAIDLAEPFLLSALTGAPAPLCELAHDGQRVAAATVIGGRILACTEHS